MNKKAAMELSINAIVILVLAITMLGLGLGFTKSMFAKFGEKLTVPEPPIQATADERVVLPSGDVIQLKKGKIAEITVNYYNDREGTLIYSNISCPSVADLTVETAPQTHPNGESKSYKYILKGVSRDVQTICNVKFGNESTLSEIWDSKQMVLKWS